MGFESGNISFRGFYLKRKMPGDAVRRFADHALPALESLRNEPITGWVTGRHLLDRHITDESAIFAGYLRLNLVKAERKIPAPLLRAECMMEELAAMQAEGLEYLKRDQRIKIKKEITERLLPDMPPQLKAIPIVCGRDDEFIFSGAMSDGQVEALILHLSQALGSGLDPMTPESAALKRKGHSIQDLVVTSLSPECADEEVSESPGLDFLTWLWFYSETRGGELETGQGTWAVMLEGPLTFVMEGSGAHEASLRKGSPLQSVEARCALLGGKKLSRARVTLARGDEQWSGELDAQSFAMRGVKLPKTEELDAVSRFQDRMLSLKSYLDGILAYYDAFLDERIDPRRWKETVGQMRKWVANREGKR
ncbi:MAG: recombination-associated protein RdgC [Verrucomicrobia bacterium]|nr:recombination-associated protein RdgC [Verrucomicrobiota bacterium]